MNKKYILVILSVFITAECLIAYGQQNGTEINNPSDNLNSATIPNLLEKVVSEYENGIKFKEVIPVAIGILAFSYFIWKTSRFLSKRDVFILKHNLVENETNLSLMKKTISYVTKYVVIFPVIVYCWVVVCFFFMYALNTSLSFDVLTLMMVGIVVAARIAAYWNEKLAEDIMKFLPFNLLFTLLYNPALDVNTIMNSIQQFPAIMLELTIFILFVGVLEAILKSIHFVVTKIRQPSDDQKTN